jgi:putative membrane protein
MTDRHPRWVYEAGDEPDPRFSLANERTFLAWVRTALAMLAGGVALHALNLLVVLGGLVTVLAMVRWARVERAMRTRSPLPAFSLGYLLTGAVVLGAAMLAVAFLG